MIIIINNNNDDNNNNSNIIITKIKGVVVGEQSEQDCIRNG